MSQAPSRPSRTLTALAAAVTASTLGLAPAAAGWAATTGGSPAAVTTDAAKVGMFGSPTRDGLEFDAVFGQSLGLLAVVADGRQPDRRSVDWLLRQQCADGGFEAFRPVLTSACRRPDPVAFTGEDTNSTALAAQALRAVGRTAQADRALAWLRAARGADGGWGYVPGAGSDPNSTGLALSALGTVDRSAVDWLAGQQVACSGLQTPSAKGTPDVLATVQALPGLLGARLPLTAPASWSDTPATSPAPCITTVPSGGGAPAPTTAGVTAGTVADGAAAWLAARPAASVTGGNAGWAVLALAAHGTGRSAARSFYAPLATVTTAGSSPAQLGLLGLSAAVLGADGDLTRAVDALQASVTAAGSRPTSTSTAGSGATGALPKTGPQGAVPAAAVGLLLLLAGVWLVLIGRQRGGTHR